MDAQAHEALVRRSATSSWSPTSTGRRIKGSWAEERVELTENESIDDRVLAHFRWLMRGDASGAPIEGDIWGVYEFREGRIVKLVYFQDADAARRAAEGGP